MAGADQCGAETCRRQVDPGDITLRRTEITLADRATKTQPDAQLKNLQRAADGQKAMADYEAEGAALRAKTERLILTDSACWAAEDLWQRAKRLRGISK